MRTPNYVNRNGQGTFEKVPPVRGTDRTPPPRVRPVAQAPARNRQVLPHLQAERKFTKTGQGRHYDNGLNLRKGLAVRLGWQKRYFPHGYVHFPFYRQQYRAGACYYSPYSFYFGICLPYIDTSVCAVYPPTVAFIDMPNYSGNYWSGYANVEDNNLINDPNLDQNEPGLNGALDEITETFQGGNIDGLASIVSPNMSIAVFLRGRYQYSLTSSNYVDLTRDAIANMQNTQLNLNYLHERSPGVFCASGSQTYTATDGSQRIVYMSFVLQDVSGQWTLTQVGTSPDVIQGVN